MLLHSHTGFFKADYQFAGFLFLVYPSPYLKLASFTLAKLAASIFPPRGCVLFTLKPHHMLCETPSCPRETRAMWDAIRADFLA